MNRSVAKAVAIGAALALVATACGSTVNEALRRQLLQGNQALNGGGGINPTTGLPNGSNQALGLPGSSGTLGGGGLGGLGGTSSYPTLAAGAVGPGVTDKYIYVGIPYAVNSGA